MTTHGIDCATPVGHLARCIRSLGYTFVCRYLPTGLHKSLTREEALLLSAAGIYNVSVYETNPTHADYFTSGRALFDASSALGSAREVGQPEGTPIYFTVDFDAETSIVLPYFEQLHKVLPSQGYEPDAYAGGDVLRELKAHGLIRRGWLAMPLGWMGSRTYTDWAMRQERGATVCGVNVDVNVSKGDAGGWRL